MKHPSLMKWERVLEQVLDELDELLEDSYGLRYRLHPARAARGKTSSRSQDGLFDIQANFSLGLSSHYGKGYVVDVHMATLDRVPADLEQEIEAVVLQKLREELPEHFPGRDLQVNKDGNVIKIHGDLSLGQSERR